MCLFDTILSHFQVARMRYENSMGVPEAEKVSGNQSRILDSMVANANVRNQVCSGDWYNKKVFNKYINLQSKPDCERWR